MNRPPFPGPPPWWPNFWVVTFGLYATGIVIAMAAGYPWSSGLLVATCITLAITRVCHWRFKRWQVRHRAFAEWLKQEQQAGRLKIDIEVTREV